MDAQEVAAQLGAWRGGGKPIYRALASQLRMLIRLGLLPPSSDLPPERQLATALAVSRNTVALAYRLLKEEGALVSVQGSSTRVSEAWTTSRRSPVDYGAAASGFISDVVRGGRRLDLAIATPQPGPWLADALRRLPDLTAAGLPGRGYEPAGHPPLRERVAQKFTQEGLPRAADEVVITNGATQALHLLVNLLGRRGGIAVVEELTCPPVLASLRNAGLRLVVTPVDRGGADVAAIEAAVHRYQPAFLYLMPTYHNPTGATMTARRRAAVAALVSDHRVPLIEDLTLADTYVAGTPPPPPIAAYAPEAEIYTVGSMSKLYWPGLRIGWLTAPRRELTHVLHLRAVYDLGCGLQPQLIAHELLGQLPQVRAERQRELRANRDALLRALDEHLPHWGYGAPEGGLGVWCRAPHPLGKVHELAYRNGMQLMLGTHFAAGARSFVDHVRLPYVLDENQLAEAVTRLAAYCADTCPAPVDTRRRGRASGEQ